MKFPKLPFVKKECPAAEADAGRLSVFMRVVLVLTALSLVLAVLCVSAPSMRRDSALQKAGKPIADSLPLVADVIAYYDSRVIDTLLADPANNENYLVFSDALAKVRGSGGFESVIAVIQNGKQYICIGDGLLASGTAAYSAGSLISPEKPVKNMLGKIFDGKSDGGVVTDVVAGRFGNTCAAVLVPITGADDSVLAVLAVEEPVTGAPYHIVAGINLYITAAVFAVIAVVCGLIIYFSVKLGAEEEEEALPSAAAAATEADKKTAAARQTAENADVTAASVADIYPAPDFKSSETFSDSTDFDTPVIPSLTLPDEENDK